MVLSFEYLFFYLIFFNKILSLKVLQKGSSIKVDCLDERVAFNCTEFNSNQEIYINFKLDHDGLKDEIKYKFYKNINFDDPKEVILLECDKRIKAYHTSTNSVNNYVYSITDYYTINKEAENNYLLMEFFCPNKIGTITVENTSYNKGKASKAYIYIVVGVILVIGIVILSIIVYRRKKEMAAEAKMQMSSAQGYSQGMGMNMAPGMVASPTPIVPGESGYINNNMVNNNPPLQNNLGIQPVMYSRVQNDMTQIASNSPNSIIEPTTEKRFKGKSKGEIKVKN